MSFLIFFCSFLEFERGTMGIQGARIADGGVWTGTSSQSAMTIAWNCMLYFLSIWVWICSLISYQLV